MFLMSPGMQMAHCHFGLSKEEDPALGLCGFDAIGEADYYNHLWLTPLFGLCGLMPYGKVFRISWWPWWWAVSNKRTGVVEAHSMPRFCCHTHDRQPLSLGSGVSVV